MSEEDAGSHAYCLPMLIKMESEGCMHNIIPAICEAIAAVTQPNKVITEF